MKTKNVKRIVLLLASFMTIGGVACGYWYYKFLPSLRINNLTWCREHSAPRIWQEFQTCIDRGVWDHSLFCLSTQVGKPFMVTVMKRIRPEDDLSECTFGHISMVLPYICNQNVGESGQAWLNWWQEHSSGTQEKWIRDGFEKFGIHPPAPPLEQADITNLLSVIGAPTTNKVSRYPFYVKINACRWLRDSNFKHIQFAISNLNTTTTEEVKRGLIIYDSFERDDPKKDSTVRLFSKEKPKETHINRLTQNIHIIYLTAIIVLLFKLQESRSRKTESNQSSATPKPGAPQ